nr:hypothetical protein [Tanacetum cinerariifolium]
MCGLKECSSCGALYNKSCGCSKGGFVDKFVRDPNKTPDSSQRPLHDCLKCGNPVDGLHCRQCALLRKKRKEVWFTICDEHKNFQDFLNTFESSNDNTNVVNAPQESFVFNQDTDKNSSQSPPHIDHRCCYGCGDSLDGIFCQRCTCESCGNGAHYGYNCPPKVPIISNPEPCHNQNVEEFPQTLPSFHPTCYSGDENSSAYDSTPNFFDDSPNVFNPPSQPPMYSYEFYGNNAHYSRDCPPQVPFIYNPKPCYNQDFNFPQNFKSFNNNVFVVPNVEARMRLFNVNKSSSMSLVVRITEIPIYYDDEDDEESSTPLRDIIISELPPDDKSFSDEDVSKEIYSNPLFDEEINSIKIDLHHFNAESDLIESLLNPDSSIISSSKINSLLDEFFGELIFLKSILPGIDEADCDPEEEIRLIKKLLYDNSSPRPPKEFNSENSDAIIKSFSPSPIPIRDSDSLMEEINLSLTPNDSMPPGIENDDYDFEGDIIILE